MESQDLNAERTEGPDDYRHPVESSYILRENTISSESVHGLTGLVERSRGEKIRELRQLGAVEFCGTIDPAEAETWLRERKYGFERPNRTSRENVLCRLFWVGLTL